MFQMSTMILGVIRNNEELVSHNIWSIFQKTQQKSVVTNSAALRHFFVLLIFRRHPRGGTVASWLARSDRVVRFRALAGVIVLCS